MIAEKEKHAGGRPTKYKDEYADLAYKYCLLGATNTDLAKFFEINEDTVNSWKFDYLEFSDAIKSGKEEADANVASRLYSRAMGYSHKETITATYQGQITDHMDVDKHYAPDTTAAIFWLKNRQPAKWRDTQNIEIAGPNGGPLLIQAVSAYSDEDLKLMAEIMERAQQISGEIVDIEPI